jgi:nucleoside-diphosphate-sugar epimerase
VASALEAVMLRGNPGQIYNAVDDEPVLQGAFLEFLAQETGLPLPPLAESADPSRTIPVRKRGTTHKRVSNRRLQEELGWRPQFSSFREGYAEAIAAVLSSPGTTLHRPALL